MIRLVSPQASSAAPAPVDPARSQAYGPSVARDLGKAIDRQQTRTGWLERCMQAMAMQMPKAVLWQKVRALRRVLPKV